MNVMPKASSQSFTGRVVRLNSSYGGSSARSAGKGFARARAMRASTLVSMSRPRRRHDVLASPML